MFDRHGKGIEAFHRVIRTFRQKGAVSPEKALSLEELGLQQFEDVITRAPRFLDVFVAVNGKYYLSEDALQEAREQHRDAQRRFRRLVRHTASVPKGFLRLYTLRLLKDNPLSGSEIMAEVKKQTDGRWEPSPGSVYPLLAWLHENEYTAEVPREKGDYVKRYTLTEKGEKLLEQSSELREELQNKLDFFAPPFFSEFWLRSHPTRMRAIHEPARRFMRTMRTLRTQREKLTDRDLKEIGTVFDEMTGRIEALIERLKGKNDKKEG
jgi:DNA-binding PadR family transcriptional regulator